jgi:hypothetical protein
MGSVSWGIPPKCLDVVLATCRIDAAVETGTYMGDSTELLAQRCREVITIEGDAGLAAAATRRLARWSHVRVLQADSRAVLPDVVGARERRALFWLDRVRSDQPRSARCSASWRASWPAASRT